MAITNYHTINGRIVGQTKDGVRTHYVPDALGSVVATLDANGTVGNTYRYKPYGSLLAKTGTGDDPRFLWVGTRGYRATFGEICLAYVRLRTLLAMCGSWTSQDPTWPDQPQYSYAGGRPTQVIDVTGLDPRINCPGCVVDPRIGPGHDHTTLDSIIRRFFNKLCKKAGTSAFQDCVQRCAAQSRLQIDPKCFERFCKKGTVDCPACLDVDQIEQYTCTRDCSCAGTKIWISKQCAYSKVALYGDCSMFLEMHICCHDNNGSWFEEWACGCKPGSIRSLCDNVPATLIHELGHICATTGNCYPPDQGNNEERLNEFANCVIRRCL